MADKNKNMSLDELYQKTIDDQRAYLLKLQDNFNKACDKAKAKAEAKLKKLPVENKEAREAALEEQKAALEEALHILKVAVDTSTKKTMRKLEEIVTEKEKLILADLEKQIANL